MVSVFPPVGHHLVDSNNGTMVTSPLITNVSHLSFYMKNEISHSALHVNDLIFYSGFLGKHEISVYIAYIYFPNICSWSYDSLVHIIKLFESSQH